VDAPPRNAGVAAAVAEVPLPTTPKAGKEKVKKW
jgi:hypothetical protein